MKAILVLLLLFYCHTSDLLELTGRTFSSDFKEKKIFFNLVSVTNAQSLGEEHQQFLCNKLRSADFDGDGLVDEEDYSFLYLVSIKDGQAMAALEEKSSLIYQMDLSMNESRLPVIDEDDVGQLYNYLTDQLPYCPYINNN